MISLEFGLELRPWKMITEEDCPDQSVAQKEHHHPPSFVGVELLLVMKSYFEFGPQILCPGQHIADSTFNFGSWIQVIKCMFCNFFSNKDQFPRILFKSN